VYGISPGRVENPDILSLRSGETVDDSGPFLLYASMTVVARDVPWLPWLAVSPSTLASSFCAFLRYVRNNRKPKRVITATHAGMPTPRATVSPFPSLEFPLPGTCVEVFEDADEGMRVEVTFPVAVTVVTLGIVVDCVMVVGCVVVGVAKLSH
jgi:hypothetical protein